MSYRRSFKKTLKFKYTLSLSYPASEHGGHIEKDYEFSEDVYVNIDVETNPFDRSVDICNTHVNALTGAVVATESAQVASIRRNSEKVAETIVNGFFKTVQSELTQQIAELSSRIDANLIHLRELAKRCKDKQRQMEVDYHRISSRYLKLFTDLNEELHNRIYEIDKPVFTFKQESDARSLRTAPVGATVIANAEGSRLQAMLSASVSKKRSLETLNRINTFLIKQKCLERILKQSLLAESKNAVIYAPVCYTETTQSAATIDRQVFYADQLGKMNTAYLKDAFANQSWHLMDASAMEQIRWYFGQSMQTMTDATEHNKRVQVYMSQFLNNNVVNSI